jgi:hypothetical protein
MSGRPLSLTGERTSAVLVPLILLVAGALLVSQVLASARLEFAFAGAAAVVVFLIAFLRTEIGLYLVIASMLLSPEFTVGAGDLAEARSVVFRTEDFLLLVIAGSWFAKTAVHKELGLVMKTPLNRPILAYVAVNVLATLAGYLVGTVGTTAGFFYVLKYVEYFVVYYMVVNNVADRAQARRLVLVALATAAIASLIGIAQIPSGARVSAPFEGEVGEPNTFGGYLLLMMALALGVALETRGLRVRVVMLGLVGLFALPFAFTLSRASYLGLVPMFAVLAFMSSRRRLMIALLMLLIVASPVLATLAPAPVARRVAYTFKPEKGQPTVHVGKVGLDPSTSARVISARQALEGWLESPHTIVAGYGVTGFVFMDAQYARVLVETGIIGLLAFLWLVVRLLGAGLASARALGDPDERGLAIGFAAGTVGLLVHALGSNTFIIVRIMEPFWLFAGIVTMLPMLPGGEPATDRRRTPASRSSAGPRVERR